MRRLLKAYMSNLSDHVLQFWFAMVALNTDLSLFKGKNTSVIDIKINEANF